MESGVAITNLDDPFLKMDESVKKEFGGEEAVRIILKFPKGINSEADVLLIKDFCQNLKDKLDDMTISCLSELFAYSTTDDEVADPWFTDTKSKLFFENGSFSISKWKREAIRFSGVIPSFVAKRNFEHVTFVLYPQRGHDEIKTARRIAEVLEERIIPSWEWFLKKDIVPANPNVEVAGWIIGRMLIDAALNYDVLTKIGLFGIGGSFLLFFAFVGSLRQALIASLLIGTSIIWVRGEIGLSSLLSSTFPSLLGSWELKERVYVLLAYAGCIVQGNSFLLHAFDSFNDCRSKWQTSAGAWAYGIRRIVSPVGSTAAITFVGFLTLYSFEVGTIQELGIISAMAVVNLVVLSMVFAPAAEMLWGGIKTNVRAKRFKLIDSYYKLILGWVRSIHGMFPVRYRASTMLSVLLGVMFVAFSMFNGGMLTIGSKPVDFVQGTAIDRSETYLNKEGREGFDVIEVFVKQSKGEERPSVYNPELLREVLGIEEKFRDMNGVREVMSVADFVSHISREKLGQSIPADSGKLQRIFVNQIGNISGEIQDQLFTDVGIRITLFTDANSSRGIREVCEGIVSISEQFPKLDVKPFGNLCLYQRVDRYITLGKPLNAFWSQLTVIIMGAMWVWYKISRNTNYKSGRVRLNIFTISIKTGLVLSVPFLFAGSMILIVMMLFDVPLDISTSAIGVLAIAAALDFSIHAIDEYLEWKLSGYTHQDSMLHMFERKGRVILADAHVNKLCFVVLITSSFVPVVHLGWMMVVTLLFAAIGTLIIMSPMLGWSTGSVKWSIEA